MNDQIPTPPRPPAELPAIFVFLMALLISATGSAKPQSQRMYAFVYPRKAIMTLRSDVVMKPKQAPVQAITTIRGDGDGVADNGSETGTPVVLNNCSGNDFAFISKRDGIENVYVSVDGVVSAVTNNVTTARTYDHIASRPGQPQLAFDEESFLGIGVLMRTEFSNGLAGSYLTDEGRELTSGYTWNADGSKAAYFVQTYRGTTRATEIHVVDFSVTPSTEVTVWVPDRAGVRFGRLVLWGDYVIFDESDESDEVLFAANWRDSAPSVRAISIVQEDGTIGFDGADPAVRADGTLAFKSNYLHGSTIISTCSLSYNSALGGLRCYGKRVLIRDEGHNSSPAWSQDGAYLFFAADHSYYPTAHNIYRVRADGTEVTAMTHDVYDDNTVPVMLARSASCP